MTHFSLWGAAPQLHRQGDSCFTRSTELQERSATVNTAREHWQEGLSAASNKYPPAVRGTLVRVLAEHGDQVVRPPQNKSQLVAVEL